jgi:hypothetical protein
MRTFLVFLSCLAMCLVSYPCYAPTNVPWLPVVHHRPDVIEQIIRQSIVPSHLLVELAWEESHVNPAIPPRHEKNGTCSYGLLQRNASCSDSNRDTVADAQWCARYIEHWWVKSRYSWSRSKVAYRRGHILPIK